MRSMNLLKFALLQIFLLIFFSSHAYSNNLIIDNFADRGGPNKIGGPSDTWCKDNAKIIKSYAKNDQGSLEFERAFNGYSLKLSYSVDKAGKEAGWWTALNKADYSKYGELSFWIRGREGGEKFKIGIKDALWYEQKLPIDDYLEDGVDKYWQQVVIPLEDFDQIREWQSLDNISFTFDNEQGDPRKGTVYIDNLTFLRACDPVSVDGAARVEIDVPDFKKLTDEQLLDIVQKTAFKFFWDETNPENGLTKDLCHAFKEDNYPVASIASVGFGFAAICVAEQRGWVSHYDAYNRVLVTLKFFLNKVKHKNGFYYHYLNMKTGERMNNCEISSIDTALFLAGAMFAGEYYKGTEVEAISRKLYERVDWTWLLNSRGLLSMGWTPDKGFISHCWDSYNESMVLYLMAIGSPTNPINPRSWWSMARPRMTYKKYRFIGIPPLFVHQYSHIWVDFKNKKDQFADYFENSIVATLANRAWCINNKKAYKGFGPDCWGLTACDGPNGYAVYGAPNGYCDGTIAPTAALGSIAFTPEYSINAMRYMLETYGDKIWGRYGFTDSFNKRKGWFSQINIGIDQGPIVLMIENRRSGMIWDYFMRNKHIQRAMKAVGFRKSKTVMNPYSEYEYREGRFINDKTICPYCKKKLWFKGSNKKTSYFRCPRSRCAKRFR